MQVFLTDNQDGSRTLLKIFSLDKEQQLPLDTIKGLCQGMVYQIDLGRHNNNGMKAFQSMLERLP
eukprot:1353548-Karenia_brevis.AAC.1